MVNSTGGTLIARNCAALKGALARGPHPGYSIGNREADGYVNEERNDDVARDHQKSPADRDLRLSEKRASRRAKHDDEAKHNCRSLSPGGTFRRQSPIV
jgi:hypothetical protein